MRSRVRNPFDFLSMSALDLFASALGVFILVAFVLLPYYLKQPSLEAQIAGARAESSDVLDELRLLEQRLVAAQATRHDAEARLIAARQRLAAAQNAPKNPSPDPEPPETTQIRKPGTLAIPDLDLVIAIDTTGSMRGEIRELQAGLLGIIRVLHRLSPSVAIGIVAYRDHGQAYVTRNLPLRRIETGLLDEVLSFVAGLTAEAGGDIPEAVDVALGDAIDLAWRDGVLGRIVVVGDAPAHEPDWQRSFEIASRFRNSGRSSPGRAVGAIYTGRDARGRAFFEDLARAGGGDFRSDEGELMASILLSVLNDARKR